MAYEVYVNGELVDVEMSFMDAMMYIQRYDLFIIDEQEHIDWTDPTIELHCVEV